ncbi:hypothetical protein [Cognatishimia sp. MH4019]|uniref:hypothetical protein n=1 Tax=Cognatishimia sp. MH4019 TaxID=2854030 RepID=UPI001CD71EE3|nr:hypothetical protein [Cognatishimia sp. MH4019]
MWGREQVGDVVNAITRLELCEEVRLDPDRLAELFVQLGQQGAEDMVCRAMEEISLRLAKVNAAYDAADLERVRKLARSLVAISDQVGLATLARVAEDVADCAVGHDRVALLAVVMRLQRIGESSVTAVWDIRDMSV